MGLQTLFPPRGLPHTRLDSRNPATIVYFRVSAIWLSLTAHRLVLLAILLLAWGVRALDPRYSSAFMDESIYVLYGRMVLTRRFEPPINAPLRFSFGWYLWPTLAAAADHFGGLVGLREMAAVLGMLTTLAVFGIARRLFSRSVGLASAFLFALLGPAVLCFRIATRDAGTLCLFALGLWLYVRAWQEDERVSWLASALLFMAAFLCKYVVAIYFPFLVIVALRKGQRPLKFFLLPLAALCATYGIHYAGVLAALLHYGANYHALQAPPSAAWAIYVKQRLDFWALLGLSLFAWTRKDRRKRIIAELLWLGAAVLLLLQLATRADYDYWKHVNYALLFLTPVAMEGLLRLFRRWKGLFSNMTAAAAVLLLAVTLGWTGKTWAMDRFVFWPNAEPLAAYFEGRLVAENRVLADDTVLRYYLSPPLHQWQITDPFYFHYGGAFGEPAYAAAVRDGYFDYIALDGGIGDDARRMDANIQPQLASRYSLQLSFPDPVLNQQIRVYRRVVPPPAMPPASGPRVNILFPVTGSVVPTVDRAILLEGVATGAEPGSYVRVDVFTNRWYRQGEEVFPRARDGAFAQKIYLAGGGRQRYYHMVRARLYDPSGKEIAVALNFGIARAEPDATPPRRSWLDTLESWIIKLFPPRS